MLSSTCAITIFIFKFSSILLIFVVIIIKSINSSLFYLFLSCQFIFIFFSVTSIHLYLFLFFSVHLAGAISLYETMHKETGKMAPILLKVLPLLENPSDARELLLYVTNGDRVAMGHIKQVIGYALKPLCGLYDGYYCLNLGLESSQLCLRRLMEVSETLRMKQMPLSILGGYGRIGDTSQKGNWCCFRNETFNHKTSFPITVKTIVPKRGILEFDFMSSARPPTLSSSKNENKINKIEVVNSNRLFGLLEKCKLMTVSDRAEALRYLRKCRDDCNRVVSGTGT